MTPAGETSGEVVVRPETPDDHGAIERIVSAAFGSDAEARLVEAIRSSPAFIPALALVAEVDGELAGHVMVSYADLDDDAGRRRRIPNLSPLAVAPEFQR